MQRDFKGVWIPRQVWLDARLNALDKIVLVEIDSLDNGEKGCYASNKYLAEFCQCSERQVSRAISKLAECGYIKSNGFDGRIRILRSCLDKMSSLPSKNGEADKPKCLQSNIDNNTSNNKVIREGAKRFTPPTIEEVQAYCQERGNNVDPERFVDFYASKGWKVGNSSMKDWKASVRTWEKRDNESKPKHKVPSNYDLSWLDAE